MDFNFSEKVRNNFDFLCSQYYFSCVAEEPYCVRYESSIVYILICFDCARSYELDVSFGLLSDEKQPSYSIIELLCYYDEKKFERLCLPQISTPKALDRCLIEFSEQFISFGQKILAGNINEFKDLEKYRDEKSNKYAVDLKMCQVRSDLQFAWKNHNYIKIIELLDPVTEYLSESENKKLAYAKKHLN